MQPLTAFAVALHLAVTDIAVALLNTRMLSDISANVGYHQQGLRAVAQNSAYLSDCLSSNQRSILPLVLVVLHSLLLLLLLLTLLILVFLLLLLVLL